MIDAIKYNLANLFNFSGREARPTFWWYVLFLVILQIIVGIVAAIPATADAVGQSLEGARAGMSEAELQGQILANMSGSLKTQALIGVVLDVAMAALLVAAFVRRLHDAGFTGWLAVIPIVGKLFVSLYTYLTIDSLIADITGAATTTDPDTMMAIQSDAARFSLVGWVAILFVIGFGILKSQAGPNKYGEEPVRA